MPRNAAASERPLDGGKSLLTTTHKSFCRFCHAVCGIEIDLADGRPVAVRGDPDHPRIEHVVERCRQLELDPWQEDRLDYHEACLATATGNLARFEDVVRRIQERGSPGAYTMMARYIPSKTGPAAARKSQEVR